MIFFFFVQNYSIKIIIYSIYFLKIFYFFIESIIFLGWQNPTASTLVFLNLEKIHIHRHFIFKIMKKSICICYLFSKSWKNPSASAFYFQNLENIHLHLLFYFKIMKKSICICFLFSKSWKNPSASAFSKSWKNPSSSAFWNIKKSSCTYKIFFFFVQK